MHPGQYTTARWDPERLKPTTGEKPGRTHPGRSRGGEGRTRYRELRFRGRDALALVSTVLVLLVGVLL